MISGPGQIPDAFQPFLVTPAGKPAAKPDAAAQIVPPAVVQPPDQVILSPEARLASALAARAGALPEVNPSRVAQLQNSLGISTDNSDAQNAKIAEKLLTEI
jgi:hypothetical protein